MRCAPATLIVQACALLVLLVLLLGAPLGAEPTRANAAEALLLSELEFDEIDLPDGLRAQPLTRDDAVAFVRGHRKVGVETRPGLLLPAPTRLAWQLTLPPNAVLRFDATVLALAEDAAARAAAPQHLEVELQVGDARETLFAGEIGGLDFQSLRLDLSRWGGLRVRLSMRSGADRRSAQEILFVAHPVIAAPTDLPRRVVLIFVDTLRPDHLGTYGYARGTSPNIDALAAQSTVFESARSVSPWTLPSTRSVLTGSLPDAYSRVESLPERLQRQGFATAMFATNLFLDRRFDMQRGWDRLRAVVGENAEAQTQHAVQWLEEQRDRDSLLLVHYMDPHLPYVEPDSYRERFARQSPPPSLAAGPELRTDILALDQPLDRAARDHLVDRYDANIAYVDDALAPLLAELREEDIVVFFADHGEEFFEHGSFEHGHSLYDELLRIPLLIRAPGMPVARVGAAVSLMDVTPSVLELLQLPHRGLGGSSLVGLAHGRTAAVAGFASRPLAFGWPLYGGAQWAVLQGDEKWVASADGSERYDLSRDAGEQVDLHRYAPALLPDAPRASLSEALGRPLETLLRLHVGEAATAPRQDLVIRVRVPGGIDKSWAGADVAVRSKVDFAIDGDSLIATWHAGYTGEREILIRPKGPVATALAGATAHARLGAGFDAPLVRSSPALNGPGRAAVSRTADGRSISLGSTLAPDPAHASDPLRADHPELREQLRALGYAVGPDDASAARPTTGARP